MTPLHLAVIGGRQQTVEYLVSQMGVSYLEQINDPNKQIKKLGSKLWGQTCEVKTLGSNPWVEPLGPNLWGHTFRVKCLGSNVWGQTFDVKPSGSNL